MCTQSLPQWLTHMEWGCIPMRVGRELQTLACPVVVSGRILLSAIPCGAWACPAGSAEGRALIREWWMRMEDSGVDCSPGGFGLLSDTREDVGANWARIESECK